MFTCKIQKNKIIIILDGVINEITPDYLKYDDIKNLISSYNKEDLNFEIKLKKLIFQSDYIDLLTCEHIDMNAQGKFINKYNNKEIPKELLPVLFRYIKKELNAVDLFLKNIAGIV
jgi:hypothetical protein